MIRKSKLKKGLSPRFLASAIALPAAAMAIVAGNPVSNNNSPAVSHMQDHGQVKLVSQWDYDCAYQRAQAGPICRKNEWHRDNHENEDSDSPPTSGYIPFKSPPNMPPPPPTTPDISCSGNGINICPPTPHY